MLKTTVREGETLLHRQLWRVVEIQASLSNERIKGSFYTDLVAMVFAFHTIEAYLNFVGKHLDPNIWKNERIFFRKEPYRGFEGKLKKVLELVECPPVNKDIRPFKTVLELKYLRDKIAHASPEGHSEADPIFHPENTEPPLVMSELSKLVTKQARCMAISDVEQFIEQVHSLALQKVSNPMFGKEALRGPTQYVVRHTTRES